MPHPSQSCDRNTLWAAMRVPLNETHHKLMLQDSTAARDILSMNPVNLTAMSRADPYLPKPYKWDALSETAKHRAILDIYANAGSVVKYYYDLGRVCNSVGVEENWVIRWFLWHSFRYRDNRDRAGGYVASQENGGYPLAPRPYYPYDAVRDQYR